MKDFDRDMDDEMHAHLEMRIQQLRATGLSAEEARRQALTQFGGLDSAKEKCRDGHRVFWEQLAREARLAGRSLWRSPGYLFVAALTLALGIGATTAVFTVVNGLLLKPLPWPESERVVSVWEGNPRSAQMPMAPAQFIDLRRDSKTLEAMAGWTPSGVNLVTENGRPERLAGASVTVDFFKVVQVFPAAGSAFAEEHFQEGKDGVVMIGYGIWRDRFALAENVIGKTARINGRERTIIGVMPAGFQTPAKAQFWMPRLFSEHDQYDRNYKMLPVLGRLKRGTTLEQARAELETLFGELRKEHADFLENGFVKVNAAVADAVQPVRPALLLLMAAVSAVLLMACVNVANLSLARGARRLGELSVRAALGASRARLMGQLLMENMLLAGFGAVAGLLFAKGMLAWLLALAPGTLPRLESVRLDWTVLGFTMAICLLAGLVFGVTPAWRLSARDPARELRDAGQRATAGMGWLRRGLAVFQVAAAVVVLMGTGLLLRSFDKLLRQDLGFDPQNLMTVRVELPPAKYGAGNQRELFVESVLRELRETPGVERAAATTFVPLQGGPRYIMRLESNADVKVADAPHVAFLGISEDYLGTMGMRVLRGRGLDQRDGPEAPRVCLVNEAYVRTYFSGGEALGKRLEIGFADPPRWMEVVGIVNDARNQTLETEPKEQVFVPLAQQGSFLRSNPALSLVARTRGGASVAEGLRQAVWRVDKDQPLHLLRPMMETLADLRAERRFTVTVLGTFAGAAALLAAIGLFGVMSGNVAVRMREFGIRMALGARPGEVTRLALRHGTMTLAVGLVCGVVASWVCAQFVRSMLYHTEVTDPLAWAGVVGLLVAVGLASTYGPARQAGKVDPMVALRNE